jgi:hypothetical protein
MSQTTAREQLLTALCDPTEWDADLLGLPEHEASRLLDAYRIEVLAEFSQGDAREILARHRTQVLAEARELITAASNERLHEIDEDDLRPSDWERHGEWCAAADVLIEAAGGVR